jgi:uncharacterized DUF497 family protein
VIDPNQLIGFDWDAGNREKNWQKHRVSIGECEEVFFNLPLVLQDDPIHSKTESRSLVLGQTSAGRYLFIVFTIRQDKIRVISARDMNEKERNLYAQANS